MKDILETGQLGVLASFSQRDTLLAFDYDGTLSPIVADPSAAFMRPSTRSLLVELAHRYSIAVISGRSRMDAMRLLEGVPLTEIIGNHGFECAGVRPEQYVRLVAEWRSNLASRLSYLDGAVIEDKRYSLAVHYRHCADLARARQAVHDAAMQLDQARLIGGKAVLNVVPRHAPDKGVALQRLQQKLDCPRALYVGDDDTDEDVFVFGEPGRLLGIRVGISDESDAAYFIKDQPTIDTLLQTILQLGERGMSNPPL